MMLKQTKIVASISDLRCEVDFIRDLFNAGMNVVRMNTAHASREGFEKLISNVREVSNRIAILMDTKVRKCVPLPVQKVLLTSRLEIKYVLSAIRHKKLPVNALL